LSTIGGVEVILILDDCFCTNLVFLLIQGTLPVQTLFFFCKIVWLFVFSEDCFHLMAYKIFLFNEEKSGRDVEVSPDHDKREIRKVYGERI